MAQTKQETRREVKGERSRSKLTAFRDVSISKALLWGRYALDFRFESLRCGHREDPSQSVSSSELTDYTAKEKALQELFLDVRAN